MGMKASIVIPSKGCLYLRYLLRALRDQSLKSFEVILVLKDCDSKTIESLCQSYSLNCVIIEQKEGNVTQALRDFVRMLKKSPIPIVFSIHPRTRKRLQEFGLWNDVENIQHLQILPPQGYFEFLALMRNCKVLMTDSGGLQEEATHPKIRKPVLVLRTSTERPEAVIHGFARVVGTNPVVVLAELEKILSENPKLPEQSPFGDGKAAIRIVEIIMSRLET